MSEVRQPGWYKDPSSSTEQLRYWDGDQWTDMTRGTEAPYAAPTEQTIKENYAPIKSARSPVVETILAIMEKLTKFVADGLVFIGFWTAVITFIFGAGGWKIGGVSIAALFWFTLRAGVILACLYYGIIKPLKTIYAFSVWKKTFREHSSAILPVDSNLTTEDFTRFAIRLMNSSTIYLVAACLTSVVIALVAHDPMMDAIGNPWSDLLTIAIMVIGSKILALAYGLYPTYKFDKENSVAYDIVTSQDWNSL